MVVSSYDPELLREGAGTVSELAARVSDLADGAGTAAALSPALGSLEGSLTAAAVVVLVGVAVEVDGAVAAALNGLSEALERVADVHEGADAAAAASLTGPAAAPPLPPVPPS